MNLPPAADFLGPSYDGPQYVSRARGFPCHHSTSPHAVLRLVGQDATTGQFLAERVRGVRMFWRAWLEPADLELLWRPLTEFGIRTIDEWEKP